MSRYDDDRRKLPQNVEAEKSVLGAILLEPSSIDDVVDVLGKNTTVFFEEVHQHLYGAMLKLQAANQPIDAISLIDALGRRVDDAGGFSYIASLTSAVPTSANVDYYARIVRETATLRKMISTCSKIIGACYNPEGETAEDILGFAEATFENMSAVAVGNKAVHISDVIETVLEDTEHALTHDKAPGIMTRIGWLDNITNGLAYSEMSVLLARPNVGKSAMMLNFAYQAAMAKVPVLIFSLEMTEALLAKRLLNIDSGVDFHRLAKRWQVEPELKKLREGAIATSHLPIFVDDNPAATGADIRAGIRRHARKHGPSLVIVDYLQKVQLPRKTDKRIEIGDVTQLMARTAKETGCHILLLGQLSRAAEKEISGYKMGQLGKESGSIEEDADMIFVLHKCQKKELESLVATHGGDASQYENCFHLTVAKSRNTPTGDNYIRFVPNRQRFYEVTMTAPEEPTVPGDPNEELEEDEVPF